MTPLFQSGIVAVALFLGCTRNSATPKSSSTQKNENTAKTLDTNPPIPQVTKYKNKYAIVIGVGDYPERLNYAPNDAKCVAKVLCEEFGYAPEDVLLLGDASVQERDRLATKSEIMLALTDWLPSKNLSELDSVFFFFAGHGTPNGLVGGIGAQIQNESEHWVKVSFIIEQLSNTPCLHKAVILASCFSGELFKTESSSATTHINAPLEDNVSLLLSRPVFQGLSASESTPISDGGGDGKVSIFTSALVKVLLERADSQRTDHAFFFSDVAARVRSTVGLQPGSLQLPMYRSIAGNGDFLFRPVVPRATNRELLEKTKSSLLQWKKKLSLFRVKMQNVVNLSTQLETLLKNQSFKAASRLISGEHTRVLVTDRKAVKRISTELSVAIDGATQLLDRSAYSTLDLSNVRLANARIALSQRQPEQAVQLVSRDKNALFERTEAASRIAKSNAKSEANVLRVLATAYRLRKEKNRYLDCLRRIVQIDPGDIESGFTLSMLLVYDNEREEAIKIALGTLAAVKSLNKDSERISELLHGASGFLLLSGELQYSNLLGDESLAMAVRLSKKKGDEHLFNLAERLSNRATMKMMSVAFITNFEEKKVPYSRDIYRLYNRAAEFYKELRKNADTDNEFSHLNTKYVECVCQHYIFKFVAKDLTETDIKAIEEFSNDPKTPWTAKNAFDGLIEEYKSDSIKSSTKR